MESLGYELVGVEYLSQGKKSLLRVYIDHEDGINLDDCERVSHQISGVLDVEDVIRGQYALEVSSPGLDRPLFTQEHFLRFSGEPAKIHLAAPQDGRRNFHGILRGVENGEVLLDVEGTVIRLRISNIEKANLVPDF